MLLIGTVETASTLTTRCYLSEELIRVADEARYAAYLAGLEERRGKAVGEMKEGRTPDVGSFRAPRNE